MQIEARYKCLSCRFEWDQKARDADCPLCGYLYVKWVNYEKDFKKGKAKVLSK